MLVAFELLLSDLSDLFHSYTAFSRQFRSSRDTRVFRISSFRKTSNESALFLISDLRNYLVATPCFFLSCFLCQFIPVFLEKAFFFHIPFLQSHYPEVRLWVCVCVCGGGGGGCVVCVRIFESLTPKYF